MHRIIYTSQASQPFSEAGLTALLTYARRANAEYRITGALVYGDGQFVQVLEGEHEAIAALYAKIAQDPRHTSVFKLTDEAIAQRHFAEWSMGFRVVSAAELAHLTGYQSPAQMRVGLAVLGGPEEILVDMMRALLQPEPMYLPPVGSATAGAASLGPYRAAS